MAFPTLDLVPDSSTHSIGASTWKWNGYAWDRVHGSGMAMHGIEYWLHRPLVVLDLLDLLDL